jgi:hypothetical protein
MPKTTRTVALVLSGLFIVFCSTLYHYADLTPANAPRPDWVNAPLPQWASANGPDQIGRMSPLRMPVVPDPSADGTTVTRHDVATDAARVAKAGAADGAEQQAAQIEDRLQGARQRAAQQTTADLELEKRREAARLAAENQKAIQAAAEAAAAERARLAQIEADRQAAAAKKSAQDQEAAQTEDRLQGARQRAAQQMTADLELEKRREAARLAAENQKAIQAAAEAAAAERARLAQIEAEKQAADAAIAKRARLAQLEADKQTAVNAAKNAAQEQEASQIEDRLQGARRRMAERVTADFELEKRAEATRLAAERQKTMQVATAAMAAEGVVFARTEAGRQAAAATKNEADEREAAQIEDQLQGARQSAAKQATADFEHERRAKVDPIATSSIPTPITSLSARSESGTTNVGPQEQSDNPRDGAPARKDARAGQNVILEQGGSGKNGQQAGVPLKDRNSNGVSKASVEPSRSSDQGDHGTENVTGNAIAASAVAARANEPESARFRPILQRRCAAILKSPSEYDNDLVSLCRAWAGAAVPGSGAGAGPGLLGGEASAGSRSANAEVPVTEGSEEGNRRSQFKRSCSFILQHSEYSRELVHLCELAHRH